MSRAILTARTSTETGHWDTYFERGERLIWEGKPQKGFHFGLEGIVHNLLGLPILLGGIFFFIIGTGQSVGLVAPPADGANGLKMALFSLPFLAAGIWLVLGPWLAGPIATRYVRYALTNRRAYIARSFLKRRLKSYPISPDSPLELEKGRGVDNVYFQTEDYRDPDGDKKIRKIGFENVADGDRIYQLLRKVQRGEI